MIGISIFKWLKILAQIRFNVRLKHVPKILLITFLNIILYPFVLLEQLIYRKKIRETKIEKDPIFIIGHWRSGTTHLHKILALDKQFGYISLTETSFPHLFLGSSKLLHTLMRPITPKKRATDKVPMFPEMPHEHEFALLFLSLYSPLLAVSFSARYEHYSRYITFEKVSQKEIDVWKKWFLYLAKKLTFKEKGKQLVLKNPLDTCRIRLILELFPNAKFVHLIRNPYDLYYSTIKLHKHNTEIYAMQKQSYNLEEIILENYNIMYEKFYEEVDLIPEGHLVNVRFEDLRDNPLEQMGKIYTTLNLENFEKAKQQVLPYLLSVANYKPSRYQITEKDKRMIDSHWHDTIVKWGYEQA